MSQYSVPATTQICELHKVIRNKDILWLDIPMKNTCFATKEKNNRKVSYVPFL
jgi:hypothetical protein